MPAIVYLVWTSPILFFAPWFVVLSIHAPYWFALCLVLRGTKPKKRLKTPNVAQCFKGDNDIERLVRASTFRNIFVSCKRFHLW